jgi:ABC-2 type transport system permease protein
MRKVWHIAGKELLQARRDKLAFLFTIVLPVVFTVFLGLLIGGTDDGQATLPLAVSDADATPASRLLIEKLEAAPLLEVKPMDATAVNAAVQEQDVAAAVEIPAGYGEALDNGEGAIIEFIRIETSSGAQSVFEAVQAVISATNASMIAAETAAEQASIKTGQPLDDALLAQSTALADVQLAAPAASVEVVASGSSTVRQIGGFDQSSSGSMVNWVLFGLLSSATTLVWERRYGLIRRLGVSGVRKTEIFGGKLVAMLAVTFLQQLFLILLGQLAFGVAYFGSVGALLMVMISLSFFAASVGVLISSVFRSEQAVIATIVIAAQLLAVLGGAWFPLEITSATFSQVAHFLPTAWVVDSLHGIILKDWGMSEVLRPMGMVWIWIVVLFGLAVWRFRPEE